MVRNAETLIVHLQTLLFHLIVHLISSCWLGAGEIR